MVFDRNGSSAHALFSLSLVALVCGNGCFSDYGLVSLPILEEDVPGPYNHSNEPSIAAHGGRVVVAYRNRHLLSKDGFEIDPAEDPLAPAKQVLLAVSDDAGQSFTAVPLSSIAPLGEFSSDPVVRVADDGTFWVAAIRSGLSDCMLFRSGQAVTDWSLVVSDVRCDDKEWLAIDSAGGALYVASFAGSSKYSFDGTLLSFQPDGTFLHALAGYTDDQGAHFLRNTESDIAVSLWNGTGASVAEGPQLGGGDGGAFPFDGTLRTSASIGRTLDGAQWIVRTINQGIGVRVALRVRRLPEDPGSDVLISAARGTSFHPAAAMDGKGRLHVIWYETGGDVGVLEYAVSRSADLAQGFNAPITIDRHALPGQNWTPNLDPAIHERIREYIDIAIDGSRAHLAWTHAPNGQSRIYTTAIDIE